MLNFAGMGAEEGVVEALRGDAGGLWGAAWGWMLIFDTNRLFSGELCGCILFSGISGGAEELLVPRGTSCWLMELFTAEVVLIGPPLLRGGTASRSSCCCCCC